MRHWRLTTEGLRRRRPRDHVVEPIPKEGLVLGSGHADANGPVGGIPVDAGFVQVRVGIRFLDAGCRLITDYGWAVRSTHPGKEGVVFVLVQPHGVGLASYRPAAPGG